MGDKNCIYLPTSFPMKKEPMTGETKRFLVEATFAGKEGEETKWNIATVDNVAVESSSSTDEEMVDDEAPEKSGLMGILMADPQPGEGAPLVMEEDETLIEE